MSEVLNTGFSIQNEVKWIFPISTATEATYEVYVNVKSSQETYTAGTLSEEIISSIYSPKATITVVNCQTNPQTTTTNFEKELD